jgi:endonuclease/exonuclease/phosphatase family metal-dependent hydrolase
MSIISFNIGYLSGMTNNLPLHPGYDFFQENMVQAVELFRNRLPTFIGFQEIDYQAKRSWFVNQLDTIAEKLQFPFGAYTVNWDKRYVPFPYWPVKVHFGKLISGQGMISQFPILTMKRIVLPKPERNPFYYNTFYIDRLIQIAQIDIRGSQLIIMNVHMEAYDKETREIQAAILKDTVERYTGKYPLLLIGDFNSRPPFKNLNEDMDNTIQTILSIPGIELALSEKEYSENPHQFFTFSSRNPVEMIDYIFHNERIEAIEYEVLQESGEISDHRPVYFKFMIKKID